MSGLDFSSSAIDAARALAGRASIDAEFVVADVYDAVEAFGERRFDVVYTGLGALNWLPDVDCWAQVMASLLAPGGRLYLAEFHPFSGVFGEQDLAVEYPYFHAQPLEFDEPGTYADLDAVTVHNRSLEWNHGIGSVVSALKSRQVCGSSCYTSTRRRCSHAGRSSRPTPTASTGFPRGCPRCR